MFPCLSPAQLKWCHSKAFRGLCLAAEVLAAYRTYGGTAPSAFPGDPEEKKLRNPDLSCLLPTVRAKPFASYLQRY